MSVGNYGGIVFKVSSKKVFTFNNLKRTRTAEWKEHDRYGQKPVSQFIAPGLDTLSFDVHIDASLGMNPRKTLDKWGKLLETGYHDIFVIGGEQVGKYEWKIENISEAWNVVMNNGDLISADITVNMSEYISSDAKLKKSTKKVTTVSTKKAKTMTKNAMVKGGNYKLNTVLTGYYTADEAANQSPLNRTSKVYPGNYYIFNISGGMVNVTKVKGSPGSWINPVKNK